ncbi:MarR family winged helix-turn-helix transcriptional regulator [Deinococcus sp. YIM 77859]|uniref:MarR family winged helix-turn-helix transcriptional regulator n=1 Tax=Deinococcus sp. YIM 77859 TaxID=1540221 RepID=UPI000552461A|nr:MarR family winged helix-turn-helix transcriptional regulator [Deinococcus sp. YIM 77859]
MGVLLTTPFRVLDEHVHHALQRAGYTDIRPAHHVVFRLTGAGGARLVDLAEQAQMTKQSMNYLIEHLEACGYVERVPDPSDRRAKIVRLTPHGREAEATARAAITDLQEEWAQHLGPQEFKQLLALLRRLNAHIRQGNP